MSSHANAGEVRLWVPGDWNGFFGLFTNVLLNVIVLTGLCLGVVQLPADTVFGRILPALGIALPLGNLFYAYLAWKLGKAESASFWPRFLGAPVPASSPCNRMRRALWCCLVTTGAPFAMEGSGGRTPSTAMPKSATGSRFVPARCWVSE